MQTYGLIRQLQAELNEAEGQMNQARAILDRMAQDAQSHYGSNFITAQDRWLAWHKCQEAETNLHNVAVALEKGARQ